MRISIIAMLLVSATAAGASTHHSTHHSTHDARAAWPRAKGGWVAYQKLSPVDDDHAKLRLVLASRSVAIGEVSVELAIPEKFVVAGLSLSTTGVDPIAATPMFVSAARGYYQDTVARMIDPAIVEYVDAHHVRLRVFPVSRGAAATVTLELSPRSGVLAGHVDESISLVALPPDTVPDATLQPYERYWPSHTQYLPDGRAALR